MIASACFLRLQPTLFLWLFIVGSWLGSAGPSRIETIAGTGVAGYTGDGGLAIHAQLNNPFGLVRGPDGALYFCDTGNHCIRKIDEHGLIETIAGTGEAGWSGDGGVATEARLFEPYEIRFDRRGDMYFVEMRNHLVRKVETATGKISTIAGNGIKGDSGDGGPAVRAQFNRPHSLQFAPDGRLFICDIGNHRIRIWNPIDGLLTHFAGTGRQSDVPDGTPILEANLNGPRAIDFDAAGNMWLALREGNKVVKIDRQAGTIWNIAGTGAKGFTGNGGPALNATLSGPKGVSIGPSGDVYLADTESHSVRMIQLTTRTLQLVAGTGRRGDGPSGDPLACSMARLHGVFVDQDGSVYVGDSEAHRIRRIAVGK